MNHVAQLQLDRRTKYLESSLSGSSSSSAFRFDMNLMYCTNLISRREFPNSLKPRVWIIIVQNISSRVVFFKFSSRNLVFPIQLRTSAGADHANKHASTIGT